MKFSYTRDSAKITQKNKTCISINIQLKLGNAKVILLYVNVYIAKICTESNLHIILEIYIF